MVFFFAMVYGTLWLFNIAMVHGKWPIEIDGLPNLKIVDLSMANCERHNQMVPY